MKKLYTILLLNLLVWSLTYGQLVPRGMKYQAVARNLTGTVMANQEITLKITLLSYQSKNGQIHYSETHTVTTNQFGLFTLTIGEGIAGNGAFNAIPWSSEDIWMEVAIRDKGMSSFATLSSSKLLAVPYAIHAATASELVGSKTNPVARVAAGPQPSVTDGVPAQAWNLFGNSTTNETKDKLGTTDYMGLIMTTNNIERLKITRDGDINIANTLNVGKDVNIGRDLNVERSVYLNKGTGGQTINYGPLTVERLSPTYLTGILTVDLATLLKSTLVVDGTTNLNSSLSVNNQSPTKLTGILDVDGATRLRNTLIVDGATDLNNTLNVDGATTLKNTLTVDGATDLNSTLNADGATTLKNTLDVDGATVLKNTLRVDGATDLKNTLNADGATTLKSTLAVDGATDLKNTLNADGATTLKSTLVVDGATNLNSALTVNNGSPTHLTGILTVDQTSALNGQVTITANVGNAEDNYDSYPLRVTGNEQGIVVKLSSSKPKRGNNYMMFMNGEGTPSGRIEGFEGMADGLRSAVNNVVGEGSDDASQDRDQEVAANVPTGASNYFNTNYAFGAFQLTLTLIDNIIRLTTNAIACGAGIGIFGDCDDVFWSSVDVIIGGIQLGGYIAYNEQTSPAGVGYESGGADYAEWLQKADLKESLTYGDVVGVVGGAISKNYVDAEKFMVVSHKPAVIGGMPEAGKENQYTKVAFMGQVPVKVVGRVCKGDYILPSGNGDGMATALAPADMKARDFARIIGVAWSESDPKKLFNYINTAVGINANDMAGMIEQMQALMNTMQLALQKAVPEYKPMLYAVGQKATSIAMDYTTAPPIRETVGENLQRAKYNNVNEAMKAAQEYAANQGVDLKQYPLLGEFFSNPTVENAQKVQNHYMKALARAQNIMARMEKSTKTPMNK
ncbi:hypothetical protein GCM10023189_15830 [Nibrella saemangeumensis]|uniref:Uncharacterized protein n=1 Tax=Nibrella saemangeumensis TaxID=1084526 RepID=A0ABP8MLE1_9BACT